MNKYSEKAEKLFIQGCNCAQAVFCAFADELGMDFDTAMKLSSSFGGGMGRLREVCGAVSSMFIIAGMKYGYTSLNDDEKKAAHYERIQEIAKIFEEKHGSIICRELLGLTCNHDSPIPEKRTEEYYKCRPCQFLVASAAEIISSYKVK